MSVTQITNVLNAEKAALDARLAATPAPVGLELVRINRSLDYIDYARQRTGESESEYVQRIDDFIQKAPAGVWRANFFSTLDGAIASDTGASAAGGQGRNSNV